MADRSEVRRDIRERRERGTTPRAEDVDFLFVELEQAERERDEARENIKRQIRLGTEEVRAERDDALRKRDGLMAQLGRTEYRLAVLKNLAPAENAAYTQADLDFFADNTDDYAARAFQAEQREAALVKALREIVLAPGGSADLNSRERKIARAALAAHEQAGRE